MLEISLFQGSFHELNSKYLLTNMNPTNIDWAIYIVFIKVNNNGKLWAKSSSHLTFPSKAKSFINYHFYNRMMKDTVLIHHCLINLSFKRKHHWKEGKARHGQAVTCRAQLTTKTGSFKSQCKLHSSVLNVRF
jgi:hypothetical protein